VGPLIRIAVCDDEKSMLAELNKKITVFMGQTMLSYQVFSFLDAEALFDNNESYDIVFLDIKMEKTNGFDVAKRLREDVGSDCFIVFVTILKEYVYDAFEVEASDYLLKPLEDERFKRTMNRIIRYIQDKKNSSLTLKKGLYWKSIPFADIYYCEAINRKIYVHTKQEIIDYYNKIEDLEKQVDTRFFKCHRSYLVNLQHVCGCATGFAELESGEKIPISRLRQPDFLQAVLFYMKERCK
jgi:DNA-binding LytR/AlgR family response regulator